MITLQHIGRRRANAWIAEWHSHHDPVHAHMWATAAYIGDQMVGCVVVAAPTAPMLQTPTTCEVTRLCCRGGVANVGTRLLGSAYRAARAMGFRRLVSYTRADESGAVYRAAGWHIAGTTKGRPHMKGNRAGRWLPGLERQSTEIVDRVRWEIGPDAAPPMATSLGAHVRTEEGDDE